MAEPDRSHIRTIPAFFNKAGRLRLDLAIHRLFFRSDFLWFFNDRMRQMTISLSPGTNHLRKQIGIEIRLTRHFLPNLDQHLEKF